MTEPAAGLVYLDHAASTPMWPEVAALVAELAPTEYANPSGAHRLARASRRRLDEARESLASVVGARPGEVVFCSGGTESDNLAVRGLAGDGRVVVSAAEHHAVLDTAVASGATVCPVDAAGRPDLEALGTSLGPDVSLVSTMLVNNEVGTVTDLEGVRRVMRRRCPAARLHTDAVQGLSWLDLRTAARSADALTVTAHKIGGPRGIGALIVRDEATLRPLLLGGGQERGRRAGTPDVTAAAGFALAAELTDARRAAECRRLAALRARLAAGLTAAIDGVARTVEDRDPTATVVPGVLHVCVSGVESEALLVLLERHGVMASAASSCSSGAQQVSHVLAAMGVEPATAGGSVRLSLGHTTTETDVDVAVRAMVEAVDRLRSFG